MSWIDTRPTALAVIADRRAEDQIHRSPHGCRPLHAGHAVTLPGKALLGEVRQGSSERVTRLGGELAELTRSVRPAQRPERSLLKPGLLVLAKRACNRQLWHQLLLPAGTRLNVRLLLGADDGKNPSQHLRGLGDILRDLRLSIG